MHPLRLKQLLEEVLASLPVPHTPEVIDDTFVAIESDPALRKRYDKVVYEIGKSAAMAWAGFWIAHLEARSGEELAPARSTLLDSYRRLTAPAPKRGKKLKEQEAVAVMAEHFRANRASLPAHVRVHRDVITELLKAGFSPVEAFAQALDKPALAR